MKRVLSLLTSAIILLTNLNLTLVFAEETAQPIGFVADTGKYTWVLGAEDVSGTNTYTYSDEYATIRVGTASNDSIIAEKGIYWSGASVLEPTGNKPNSVADSNRYIMVKPAYSGKLYITLAFPGATSSGKGRAWYYDYGEVEFDSSTIDLSTNRKKADSYDIGQVQIGSDFQTSAAATKSFDVTANHTYLIYTYNKAAYLSSLYYTSDSIVGKTATPVINLPVTEGDTTISGTCAEGASVSVKINGGAAQSAAVNGTEWTLTGLSSLSVNDTISVTATKTDYKKSNAAEATVIAAGNVSTLKINSSEHGTVTSEPEAGRILNGTPVTLTVTPKSNLYRLKTLTVGGEEVTDKVDKDNTYSFTISADTEVTAVFEEKPYHSIAIVQGDGGTVSAADGIIDDNGTIKAAEGDKVTLSVEREDGYRIKSLTLEYGAVTEEIKYGNSFVMPASDVTVTAQFKEEDVVSYVDTSFDTYDRITLMVDDKPFFYNGVQVRPDNAYDQLKFTDDQVKEMYLQTGADGYTVVNSQIRWRDVQPDTEIYAAETGHIAGGSKTVSAESITAGAKDAANTAYITFNSLPTIDADA